MFLFYLFALSSANISHTYKVNFFKPYFYFCIQTQMGVIKLFHNRLFCSLSAMNLNFLFAQALQWSTQINVFVQKYPFLCLQAYQHSEKCFILFYHMPALYFSMGALNLIIYWDIGRKKNSLLEHLCHTWINLDWMRGEIAIELFFVVFFKKYQLFPKNVFLPYIKINCYSCFELSVIVSVVFAFLASGVAHWKQRIYWLHIDFPGLPPMDLTWITRLCL